MIFFQGVKEKFKVKIIDYFVEKLLLLLRKKLKNYRRVILSFRFDRYFIISLQSSILGFFDSVFLSFNLVSRLRKISFFFKMFVLLSYVNLEKYDGGRDVDKCYVYVRNQSDDDICSILFYRSESYDREFKFLRDFCVRGVDGEFYKISIDFFELNYVNIECIYVNDFVVKEVVV